MRDLCVGRNVPADVKYGSYRHPACCAARAIFKNKMSGRSSAEKNFYEQTGNVIENKGSHHGMPRKKQVFALIFGHFGSTGPHFTLKSREMNALCTEFTRIAELFVVQIGNARFTEGIGCAFRLLRRESPRLCPVPSGTGLCRGGIKSLTVPTIGIDRGMVFRQNLSPEHPIAPLPSPPGRGVGVGGHLSAAVRPLGGASRRKASGWAGGSLLLRSCLRNFGFHGGAG